MLTTTEAADVPVETNDQARIAALGITIGQFVKTLRGMTLIQNEKRFVLQGRLYQGYNEKALEVAEDLCSDREIEETGDIDGTKQVLLDTRQRRLDGNAYAKNREHGERKKLKIAQERDELELILLRRQIAKLEPEDRLADPTPDPEPEIHACGTCGATFESANKLRGHRVGSKH